MNVRELMTPRPMTLPSEAPLSDAWEIMSREDIHELPVVDDGRLVGIITHRDVAAVLGGLDLDEVEDDRLDASVSSRMTEQVACLSADTSAAEACRELADLRIGAMPVVNGEMILVGILSVTDLLSAAADLFDQAE